MSRTLDNLNPHKNPYIESDTVNAAGFPAFERPIEERYLQVLLTNSLTGTFYARSTQLVSQSLALHAEMAATAPGFMARALVYARTEGLMRLQPILGLAYLAKADHQLFSAVFDRVIRTPGDLADFVEIVRDSAVPGRMGRAVKRAINAWLNNLSEYHAIKYSRGGQGYSLADILRLTHPVPVNERQDAIFMWLVDRERWAAHDEAPLTPQIAAFEALKRLPTPVAATDARSLIEVGRLPYEVVTGVVKPDCELWGYLLRQMPYLALLRHLNTLQRAGVFNDASQGEYVVGRLSDAEAIRKAMVLPFQLYAAYVAFEPESPDEKQIQMALVDALEMAFVNMPALGKRVCIAPDVSGSMSGRLSHQGATRYIDVAAIFAAALVKSNPNALALPFDTGILPLSVSSRDSMVTIANQVAGKLGGGTAISAPISHLLDNRIQVDTFIGITDNVEWATDQSGRTGFLAVWNAYRQEIAPAATAFLLTIAPYPQAVAPPSRSDVHFIYGWSDAVLKYMALTQNGIEDQAASVRRLSIL
ncbi:MAG: TROVE domain-containing protein [Chloroflexi bacterium]|nr:TROVE domain-containing protein [Chloroflexota bacterium]